MREEVHAGEELVVPAAHHLEVRVRERVVEPDRAVLTRRGEVATVERLRHGRDPLLVHPHLLEPPLEILGQILDVSTTPGLPQELLLGDPVCLSCGQDLLFSLPAHRVIVSRSFTAPQNTSAAREAQPDA